MPKINEALVKYEKEMTMFRENAPDGYTKYSIGDIFADTENFYNRGSNARYILLHMKHTGVIVFMDQNGKIIGQSNSYAPPIRGQILGNVMKDEDFTGGFSPENISKAKAIITKLYTETKAKKEKLLPTISSYVDELADAIEILKKDPEQQNVGASLFIDKQVVKKYPIFARLLKAWLRNGEEMDMIATEMKKRKMFHSMEWQDDDTLYIEPNQ